jgi:ABC-type transport system involved in multi-copper enzyme maturation permease subunit
MWIKSVKLIWRQNRFFYVFLCIIGFLGTLFLILSYPGEEGILAFLEITDTPFGQAFLGQLLTDIGGESSGLYLYFILIYFIAYATFIFPMAGVWLGGTGIVDEIKAGMGDVYMASPNRKMNLALRHLLTHGAFFTVLILTMYLEIPILFDFFGYTIPYERIATAFLLYWILGTTFFAVTFFFSLVTVNNEIGRGIGGLLFMVSFVLTLITNANPNVEDLKYLNITYYTNPSEILILGKELTTDIFYPLILTIILLVLGVTIFTQRDPLPLQLKPLFKSILKADRETESQGKQPRKKKAYFNRLFTKISPLSDEQWRADRVLFVFYLIILVLLVLSIILGYPEGEGGYEQLAPVFSNNPIVKSITRGHDIADDPIGILLAQFYGYTWLYFAPLVIIIAIRVIDRDYSSQTVDLIYGNPVTPRKILLSRLFTAVVEILILVAIAGITLILGQIVIQREAKLVEQVIGICLIPLMYVSFLVFLVAIALVFPPYLRKRGIYGLGGLTIILLVIPYIDEKLLGLRYFSLLYWGDLVGLLSQDFPLDQISMLFVLVGVLVASITFINYYSSKMTII